MLLHMKNRFEPPDRTTQWLKCLAAIVASFFNTVDTQKRALLACALACAKSARMRTRGALRAQFPSDTDSGGRSAVVQPRVCPNHGRPLGAGPPPRSGKRRPQTPTHHPHPPPVTPTPT